MPDLIQDLETGAIASWLKLEPRFEPDWSGDGQLIQDVLRIREIWKSEGRLTPTCLAKSIFVATARGERQIFYFERFPTYFQDTPASVRSTHLRKVPSIYHDLNDDGSILAIESGF